MIECDTNKSTFLNNAFLSSSFGSKKDVLNFFKSFYLTNKRFVKCSAQ